MDKTRPLLTNEAAYQALLQYFQNDGKRLVMSEMFERDSGRFDKFRYR